MGVTGLSRDLDDVPAFELVGSILAVSVTCFLSSLVLSCRPKVRIASSYDRVGLPVGPLEPRDVLDVLEDRDVREVLETRDVLDVLDADVFLDAEHTSSGSSSVVDTTFL